MDPQNQYYGYPTTPIQQQGPNKMKRIIIVVVGGLMLITILVAGYFFFFTEPTSRPEVARLAAMHQEMVRISDLGLNSDRARRDTKHLAATTKIVSTNNRKDITSYMSNNLKSAPSKEELKAEKNGDIDTILSDSAQLNRYDTKFEEIVGELLTQINSEIIKTIKNTDSVSLKETLNAVGEKNQTIIDSLR